jgi:hypothetical protein
MLTVRGFMLLWFTMFMLSILALLGIARVFGFGTDSQPRFDSTVSRLPEVIAAVVIGVSVLLAWLFARLRWHWSRNGEHTRHPQREGQAVWGLAAFYAGPSLLGTLGSMETTSIYQAARPEWLSALVGCNSQQVDDATYLRWVGKAKPAAEEKPRPFAG